jgi:hypothetical protein
MFKILTLVRNTAVEEVSQPRISDEDLKKKLVKESIAAGSVKSVSQRAANCHKIYDLCRQHDLNWKERHGHDMSIIFFGDEYWEASVTLYDNIPKVELIWENISKNGAHSEPNEVPQVTNFDSFVRWFDDFI